MTATPVVLVDVGAQRLALPTSLIREVAHAGTVTPVPTAPPPVAGLTQVRGQILPVLDLCDPPRLPRPNDALVVLEQGSARAALLVDRVLGVERVTDGDGATEVLDVPALFARVRERIGELHG